MSSNGVCSLLDEFFGRTPNGCSLSDNLFVYVSIEISRGFRCPRCSFTTRAIDTVSDENAAASVKLKRFADSDEMKNINLILLQGFSLN